MIDPRKGYNFRANNVGSLPKVNRDLPLFYGGIHTEEFMDWIVEVKSYFDWIEMIEPKKVKVVTIKLKGRALA